MTVRLKLGSGRVAFVVGLGSAVARLIFISNASAQEPTPTPFQVEVERVIVTGSNIPTAKEESSLPETKYQAEWLQTSGADTPVEGLRQLPSFVGNAATENNSVMARRSLRKNSLPLSIGLSTMAWLGKT